MRESEKYGDLVGQMVQAGFIKDCGDGRFEPVAGVKEAAIQQQPQFSQ